MGPWHSGCTSWCSAPFRLEDQSKLTFSTSCLFQLTTRVCEQSENSGSLRETGWRGTSRPGTKNDKEEAAVSMCAVNKQRLGGISVRM